MDFGKKHFKLLAIIIIALLIPLTVLIAQKQQEIRQRASGRIAAVFLKLSPSELAGISGENLTIQVTLEAANYQITAAGFTLAFDPALLELLEFQPSPAFNEQIKNTVDNESGSLVYTAVNTGGLQSAESVPLGTLNFRAKSEGSASVGFQNVQITALGFENALPVSSTPPTTYIINSPTPTPTVIPPTPTCSPRPACLDATGKIRCSLAEPEGGFCPRVTPTLTATPTLLPTATPTEVPTPTDSPTPTLTPTPTFTPTPTPLPPVGDINDDYFVNILDFNIWRDEFLQTLNTKQSDLNTDNKIDLIDFNIWRGAFNP